MTNQSELVGERARIYKRADTWHCTVQHNGKQIRRTLKTPNKKAARQRALELERELSETSSRPSAPPTLQEVVERYLAKCAAGGSGNRKRHLHRG